MEVQSLASSSALTAQAAIDATKAVKNAPAVTEAAVPPVREVDEKQVRDALDSVNQVVQVYNRDVEFTVDKATGIDVVKVVDNSSHEVIRQLPVEAVINFARTLDTLQGLLVKQRI